GAGRDRRRKPRPRQWPGSAAHACRRRGPHSAWPRGSPRAACRRAGAARRACGRSARAAPRGTPRASRLLFHALGVELRLLERLHARLPLRVREDQLDLLLDLLELLIAEAREANPLFEALQRLVERQLLRLEALHDLLELLKGLFEFVRAGAGHHDSVGQVVSMPSVFASTVHDNAPRLSCSSIGSPTPTAFESRIGLRPRRVREKAMA